MGAVMAKYALVSPTDVILEFRWYDTPPDAVTSSATKPRLLPVVLADVVYDLVTETREGPVYTVQPLQVTETYTKRAKSQGEIDFMKAIKIAEVKNETFRRAEALMSEQEQRLYACLGVDLARTNGAYINWPPAGKTVF